MSNVIAGHRYYVPNDDGQTNSVSFDLSVWPSSTVPSQRTADGLTTDRQTNSVSFDISVWPSSTVPSQRIANGLTTDRRILLVLTYLSGRRTVYHIEPADGGRVDDGQTNSVCVCV